MLIIYLYVHALIAILLPIFEPTKHLESRYKHICIYNNVFLYMHLQYIIYLEPQNHEK